MSNPIQLSRVLTQSANSPEQSLALFALLNLGVLESLTSGALSAAEALGIFFHAENCLYVHQRLRDSRAEDVMSHGVQLPDLFDILPPKEAQREFQRELATMRSLCLTLLEEERFATTLQVA